MKSSTQQDEQPTLDIHAHTPGDKSAALTVAINAAAAAANATGATDVKIDIHRNESAINLKATLNRPSRPTSRRNSQEQLKNSAPSAPLLAEVEGTLDDDQPGEDRPFTLPDFSHAINVNVKKEEKPKTPESACCKKTSVFSLALLAALPFAVNAMMAPSHKSISALRTEGMEVMSPALWALGGFFLLSSLGVNIPLTFDYFPKLIKEFKNTFSDKTSTARKLETVLVALPAIGAGISAGVIGFESFEWIPNEIGMWSACSLNAIVSFMMTTATRTIGTRNIIDRFQDRNDPHKQLQRNLMKSLKHLPKEKTALVQSRLNTLPIDLTKPGDFMVNFLSDEGVKSHLSPVKQISWSQSISFALRLFFAIPVSIAGGMTFSQKFIDGIVRLEKLAKNTTHFADSAKWIKGIPGVIAGSTTAALYFISVVDAFPIIYDSLTKRHHSCGKSLLGLCMNILACASMYNVAIGVTHDKNNIFSEIISTSEIMSHAFSVLNAMGALAVNSKSFFNLICREPDLTPPVKVNSTIYYLEQNRLDNALLDKVQLTYNAKAATTQSHGIFSKQDGYEKLASDDSAPAPRKSWCSWLFGR